MAPEKHFFRFLSKNLSNSHANLYGSDVRITMNRVIIHGIFKLASLTAYIAGILEIRNLLFASLCLS